MTSVWDHSHFRWKHPSIAPLNSPLPPPKSREKLSNQPTGPLGAKLLVSVVPTASLVVRKYIKEDLLQQIFKTVLEAQTFIIFKNLWNKPLKAHSPDVYCKKSYIKYYNFCQQCENYFNIIGAR